MQLIELSHHNLKAAMQPMCTEFLCYIAIAMTIKTNIIVEIGALTTTSMFTKTSNYFARILGVTMLAAFGLMSVARHLMLESIAFNALAAPKVKSFKETGSRETTAITTLYDTKADLYKDGDTYAADCPWCSRIECVGKAGVDQSCRGFNLYQDPRRSGNNHMYKQFYYLRRPEDPALPSVVKEFGLSYWGGPGYITTEPVLEKVMNQTEASTFLSAGLERRRGLTLAFFLLWSQNMAHALFDAFYPAYVAAGKFGHWHSPFRLLSNQECEYDKHPNSMHCKHERAMKTFAENNPPFLSPILDFPALTGHWVVYDEIIFGSTNGGEYTAVDMLPWATLPQWKNKRGPNPPPPPPEDPLKLFSERLMTSHGIQPRSVLAADQHKATGRPLQVLLTESKRFTPQTTHTLKSLAERLTNMTLLGNHDRSALSLNVKFLNWGAYPTFAEQLAVVNEADVLVTNRGTSMFWCSFLRPGSTCALLGTKEHMWPPSDCVENKSCPPTNTELAPPLPHYGEESIVVTNRYINLHRLPLRDIHTSQTDSFDTMTSFIKQAVALVMYSRSEIFPIDNDDDPSRFSIIGNIFRDLVKHSPSSREGLGPTSKSVFMCHSTRVGGQASFAAIVYERPFTIEQCGIDVKVLRRIKRQYHLEEEFVGTRTGNNTKCDCVVCVACV